jgi:diguanylate cyclase (GGDEF)-like protein
MRRDVYGGGISSMNYMTMLEKQNKYLMIIIGFAFIGVVGVLDFLTGYELAFSLFYVIPVSFITWFMGRTLGLIASFVSSLVWYWADIASGHLYSSSFIPIWNTLIGLSFFVITTVLLSTLKSVMNHEAELARTDNLTGAINSRFFYDLLQIEIDRFRRYGTFFSLLYIDLDNFKIVNDQYGHAAGDQALQIVVEFIRKNLRKSDVVARLGGDEFALLLPETNSEVVHRVCLKIQEGLLERMRLKNWPITFSIGVLTCESAPPSADFLVSMVDELMYSVKRSSKNAIKYSKYKG